MEHGRTDYCFRCDEYPCDKYEHIDEYDSFISPRNQKADSEKARQIGIDAYNEEQKEKARILDFLLSHFNDGRKKTQFCAYLFTFSGAAERFPRLSSSKVLTFASSCAILSLEGREARIVSDVIPKDDISSRGACVSSSAVPKWLLSRGRLIPAVADIRSASFCLFPIKNRFHISAYLILYIVHRINLLPGKHFFIKSLDKPI